MRVPRRCAFELQLPLDDGTAGDLARARLDHLGGVNGMTPAMHVRLARAFPTLGAIYCASEVELARIVGPVAAARIRWFLDAPLDTRLATDFALAASRHAEPPAAPSSMPTAA